MSERARAVATVSEALSGLGTDWQQTSPSTFAVTLPGEHKLKTECLLDVGEHSLRISAFVVRCPDEAHEQVWRWLLEHNSRAYGVAFALDRVGDIYLVGRVPLSAVTVPDVDQLLGSVLELSDGSFDSLLRLGFAESIRAEWRWRLDRGESTANLTAFQELRPPS